MREGEQIVQMAIYDYRSAVIAAIEKSNQLSLEMDIAVVDAGANLKAELAYHLICDHVEQAFA